MSKIQLSQRMYSIRDIHRLLQSREMVIQPKYQRRRTPWPLTAKSALIDTVLNGYPIPPVYLRDYVHEQGKRQKEIIDGQQRISTLIEFFGNEFKLSKNIVDADFAGCLYSELPSDVQLMIEDFEVSFISIRGASGSDIVSIFARLNSYSLPLNNQEKRNSRFAGEMKTIIYEIASEYNTFWLQSGTLSEAQIARMNDALLVSEIVFTILNGYVSSSSSALNRMYEQYDASFPDASLIYKRFEQVISLLGNFFEDDEVRKAFKPKFMFYTLFMVLYSKLFGFPEVPRQKAAVDVQRTKEEIETFARNYNSDEFDPVVKAEFKQGTTNTQQRKFRHEKIAELVT